MQTLNRNFSSLRQAISFLRREGFKPTTSPTVWKKVQGQRLREVHLHQSGLASRVKIVEVGHVQR